MKGATAMSARRRLSTTTTSAAALLASRALAGTALARDSCTLTARTDRGEAAPHAALTQLSVPNGTNSALLR